MNTHRPYVVAGSAEALARLGPWLDARRARQPVVVLDERAGERLLASPRRRLPRDTEAVLIVGPKRRSPATFLPGLFLDGPAGQRVPVGWLPDCGERIATFAQAAGRVLARNSAPADRRVSGGTENGGPDLESGRHGSARETDSSATLRPGTTAGTASDRTETASAHLRRTVGVGPDLVSVPLLCADGADARSGPAFDREIPASSRPLPGPVVVLGQWQDRFLRVSARTVRWFEKHGGVRGVHRWTAERIVGPDVIRGLMHGPGLAFYYGHGRERGFAGYHGLRAKHLPEIWPEPVAALLAVCCDLASRRRIGLSFTEELVLRGAVVGALAATRRTLHDHNRQLGPAFCEALVPGGARTLAEVVARAPIADGILPGPYRFIGDPAVPLLGAPDAAARCAEVFAPAADTELPAFIVPEIDLPALAS